jgi:hypothetical protein
MAFVWYYDRVHFNIYLHAFCTASEDWIYGYFVGNVGNDGNFVCGNDWDFGSEEVFVSGEGEDVMKI